MKKEKKMEKRKRKVDGIGGVIGRSIGSEFPEATDAFAGSESLEAAGVNALLEVNLRDHVMFCWSFRPWEVFAL